MLYNLVIKCFSQLEASVIKCFSELEADHLANESLFFLIKQFAFSTFASELNAFPSARSAIDLALRTHIRDLARSVCGLVLVPAYVCCPKRAETVTPETCV